MDESWMAEDDDRSFEDDAAPANFMVEVSVGGVHRVFWMGYADNAVDALYRTINEQDASSTQGR